MKHIRGPIMYTGVPTPRATSPPWHSFHTDTAMFVEKAACSQGVYVHPSCSSILLTLVIFLVSRKMEK